MAKYDEEEITCPVCGNPVGLDVASCPHCGAEFEEEEEAEAKPAPAPAPAKSKGKAKPAVEEPKEDEVACPVCGKNVGLTVASCPHCGAEFEEEEVEEVIEVEERQVEVREVAKAEEGEEAEEVEAAEEEEAEADEEAETRPIVASILDMKVIGVALIMLGIIGSQIAFMIDWYWTWVPPIGDNLAMYVSIPVLVLVVGLMVWFLVKKVASGRKSKLPSFVPTMALTLFLFGIFALIMMLLWDPINSAMQDSQLAVAGGFVLVMVVGIGLMFMGSRTKAKAECD